MKPKKIKKSDYIRVEDKGYNSKFFYIPKGSPYESMIPRLKEMETKWVHRCDNPQPCKCPKMKNLRVSIPEE